VSARVVTLGEAMLRLTAAAPARLEQAMALDVHVAGSEANVAAGLARLGVATRWIGALPDNPLGARVAAELTAAGVDLSGVAWAPEGRLGVFFAEEGVPPRPTTVWYDRRASAFAALEGFDPALLDGARFAVVSGITPALGDRSRALTEAFAAAASERGAGVCVDVNYRERLWTPEAAREGLRGLLGAAEVVVCGARDARLVLGCEGDESAVLARLRERWAPSARVVVLTRGEDGALASDADGRTAEQSGVRTEVVDRFGAGDAFLAGLLWGLLERDLELGLKAGVTLAALKCSIRGDLARFGRDELERAMRSSGRGMIR
jgi:2-dehydro-3-deoxygluconokinase